MKRFEDFADVIEAKKIDDNRRKKAKLKAYSSLRRKARIKALPTKAKKKFNAKAYLKAIDSPYKL